MMKIMEISITTEKYAYILTDVIEVPAGTSKKTGKDYPAFSMIKCVIHGQSEVSTFTIDPVCLDEVKEAVKDMDYLAPVKVIGIQNATGSFKVTAVEDWEGAK